MALQIVETGDHSKTLWVPELNETYHSRNGAVEESRYVFLKQGLELFSNRTSPLSILEVGFGTGLNAILTLVKASEWKLPVLYHTLETRPLPADLVEQLGYNNFLDAELQQLFTAMHHSEWDKPSNITPDFTLHKQLQKLEAFEAPITYDLIYFDAFAPDKQPELWTLPLFQKLYGCLSQGGIFVTYSSKGDVKRALREAGFTVERLPGPPRKRHMLRATKL